MGWPKVCRCSAVHTPHSVNDWHNLHPLFENSMRRAYERLLRKLLKYPNGPAVVLVHSYCWLRVSQASEHGRQQRLRCALKHACAGVLTRLRGLGFE